jgi:hypothetical protein
MATTTNYGWTTPDDTALVKDGAAAIRTLGSSVDTTTKALNPSTTLGDIEYRSSTANTNTRLGIGTSGQFLTVSGGVPAWTTPATGGGMTLLASGSVAASSTGFDLTGISGSYEELKLKVMDIDLNASTLIRFRLNSDSGANYWSYLFGNENAADVIDITNGGTSIGVQYDTFSTGANGATVILNLPNYSDSIGYRQYNLHSTYVNNSGTNSNLQRFGFWKTEDPITGISLTTSSSSFDSGATYELWGIK